MRKIEYRGKSIDGKLVKDGFVFENTPAYRMHFLECIYNYVLKNEFLTKEELRKQYYNSMAMYYSVDHSNPNRREERIEQNLIEKIEASFIEAANRRECQVKR